jgi:hypothetical protein
MSYHVNRPSGFDARAFTRRADNRTRDRLLPGKSLDGVHLAPPRRSKKRDMKRELVAQARRDTGRERMGWKATKKYMRRLDRIARIASTIDLQDG